MQNEYSKFFTPSLMLETSRVALRLMQPTDIDALFSIAGPAEIWKYFTFELNDKATNQQLISTEMQ